MATPSDTDKPKNGAQLLNETFSDSNKTPKKQAQKSIVVSNNFDEVDLPYKGFRYDNGAHQSIYEDGSGSTPRSNRSQTSTPDSRAAKERRGSVSTRERRDSVTERKDSVSTPDRRGSVERRRKSTVRTGKEIRNSTVPDKRRTSMAEVRNVKI
eukprot:CAMPEP_0182421230 /NCGR_PEP_ID=MMETSP1167-20130531/6520_1 /TAXON_ID=2988 /ORGANISM="Mallomonas Sp, Strain CCMP3275" /LENGTH=153 /DNA_ID=CAMNT_0024598141 /DNA_START=187 /DNA_END=648 /DNA_ORIENTATION=+